MSVLVSDRSGVFLFWRRCCYLKLKEFDITLDIKKTNHVPYFEVVAGDFETNVLNIVLTDDTPYNLDGLSAEIAFAKSDKTTVVQDESNGVVIEDNIIKCTLASNTIAVAGTVFAEVRVLQDAKVLTSPRFKFYVREPILNDKTVASSNEFPMLVQAIEDAKEAATNAQEAAQEAGEAANNILNGVNTHNESTTAHADIRDDIRTVEAIARSKATTENLGRIKVGSNLKIDEHGVLSVDTTDQVEQDNTKPVTSAAVHAQLGNVEALLSII